ncbi:MAG TPA: ParA family protein [Spirochaetales bacterium]|nr:ParA family protein [Spirochaetales bacterium]
MIFAFANQKGGVGKTTTAVNLGAYIAEVGKRVLLVDFDPQCNMSSSVGADIELAGIYEALGSNIEVQQCIQETTNRNLYIIPSNINLTGATVELVSVERREYQLRETLLRVENEFDFVFIDCPPSLGILTINALVAASRVIIPLQCEYFALEGLSQLLSSINIVRKELNPSLDIGGIVFTMYDIRTRLAHEVVQEVTGYFKNKVFQTIIPRNVRLSEAPSHAKTINQYDPDCLGAKSYKRLAEEVIRHV